MKWHELKPITVHTSTEIVHSNSQTEMVAKMEFKTLLANPRWRVRVTYQFKKKSITTNIVGKKLITNDKIKEYRY